MLRCLGSCDRGRGAYSAIIGLRVSSTRTSASHRCLLCRQCYKHSSVGPAPSIIVFIIISSSITISIILIMSNIIITMAMNRTTTITNTITTNFRKV